MKKSSVSGEVFFYRMKTIYSVSLSTRAVDYVYIMNKKNITCVDNRTMVHVLILTFRFEVVLI